MKPSKRRKTKKQRREYQLYLQREKQKANCRQSGAVRNSYIALLFCLLPSLWISRFGYQSAEKEKLYWNSIEKIRWIKTTGEIIGLEVVPTPCRYAPVITYAYFVDGKKYVSNRSDFVGSCPTKAAHARRIISSYSLQQNLPIYYANHAPNFAVLDPFSRAPWRSVGAWFLAMASPFWLVFLGFAIRFQLSLRPRELKTSSVNAESANTLGRLG